MKEIIGMERELEVAKTPLALRQDFNLYDSFRVFDTEETGKISVNQLINGMGIYGV